MLRVIHGGKEDLSMDQELEALEEQTSKMLRFKEMSEGQRRLLTESDTLKDAVRSIDEVLFWITERYC